MNTLTNHQTKLLICLHQNCFLTCMELEDLFEIPMHKIRLYLVKYNLLKKSEFRFKSEKYEIAIELGYKSIHDCIIDNYNKTNSAKKVGEILGCTKSTIIRYLQNNNIKTNPRGGRNYVKLLPEQLQEIVSRDGESTKKLGEEFGVSSWTICRHQKQARLKAKK